MTEPVQDAAAAFPSQEDEQWQRQEGIPKEVGDEPEMSHIESMRELGIKVFGIVLDVRKAAEAERLDIELRGNDYQDSEDERDKQALESLLHILTGAAKVKGEERRGAGKQEE